jgi:synaptic vesicle membrane protein VAT-1
VQPGPGEHGLLGVGHEQMRRGKYYDQPPFPFVPGYDLVGVVERSGNGAGPRVGQRVAALTKVGGWADRTVLDSADLVPVPEGLDPVAVETIVVNGITAWRCCTAARA